MSNYQVNFLFSATSPKSVRQTYGKKDYHIVQDNKDEISCYVDVPRFWHYVNRKKGIEESLFSRYKGGQVTKLGFDPRINQS